MVNACHDRWRQGQQGGVQGQPGLYKTVSKTNKSKTTKQGLEAGGQELLVVVEV